MLKELFYYLNKKHKKEASAVAEINVVPGTINSYDIIYLFNEEIGSLELSPTHDEYYFIENIPENSLAICSIDIKRNFRGKGYFSLILKWISDFAQKNGYTSLFLRVDDSSEISQSDLEQIYKSKGFAYFDADTSTDDLVDQTYMIKHLNVKTASQLSFPFFQYQIDSLTEAISDRRNDIPLQETLTNLNAINIRFSPLNKVDGSFEYYLVDLTNSDLESKNHDENILLLDAQQSNSSLFIDGTYWANEVADPEEYIEAPHPLKDFWSAGNYVYHGTDEENAESIMRNGLMAHRKTRGISNSGVGASVFTTFNPEEAEHYGDIVLQIDIGAMANKGITFPVQLETDYEDSNLKESLAHLIGLRYYEPQIEMGMSSDTVIIHGNIHPDFISIYEF
jgi:hypothetical protein